MQEDEEYRDYAEEDYWRHRCPICEGDTRKGDHRHPEELTEES